MSAVTVYSQPNCYQCRLTIQHFKDRGVTPNVIDISQDAEADAYVRTMGIRSMPIVETQDNVRWGGFQPDELKKVCP